MPMSEVAFRHKSNKTELTENSLPSFVYAQDGKGVCLFSGARLDGLVFHSAFHITATG